MLYEYDAEGNRVAHIDQITGARTEYVIDESSNVLTATEIDNGNVVICPSIPSIEYWFLLHFEDKTDLLKDYRAISNILAPYIKPCFADPTKNLKKLLKQEKYLQDSTWVKSLCSDGKLDTAIKRAEDNIKAAEEAGDLANQSYSYVYKAFKER